MRGLFVRTTVVLAATIAVLMLADTGAAQRNRREARGVRYTKAQVKQVIVRVEDRVDNFVRNFDRSLDRSTMNGTNREDWLNRRARDLETATDELAREFDRRDAWVENRDETRRCLNIANDIDRNVRRNRYGAATESNWSRVRFELNTLAAIYNLPRVGANSYR